LLLLMLLLWLLMVVVMVVGFHSNDNDTLGPVVADRDVIIPTTHRRTKIRFS